MPCNKRWQVPLPTPLSKEEEATIVEDPVIPPEPDAPLEALLATVPWPEG